MKAKIKSLKVNLSDAGFVDPSKVNDGTNGKILEQVMINQGFPVDQSGIVDLPGGIEIKSRKSTTESMHTVGTMTYDDIVRTPWHQTTFKQKLQKQYRVTIHKNELTDEIDTFDKIVDFSNPEIQSKLEEAYERNRLYLMIQHGIIKGQTVKAGGQYGKLEHKPGPSGTGKSYALRIPNSGMKKLIVMATSTYYSMFEEL
jgi:hypothetical protein